jgi:hypothetical protein
MDLIYIILGINVSLIFLFNKKILDTKKHFIALFLFNIILFLIAIFFLVKANFKTVITNVFFIPIIVQIIYYCVSRIFYSKYNRISKDTFWTMDRTLFIDGWFNYFFWIVSIVIFLLFF